MNSLITQAYMNEIIRQVTLMLPNYMKAVSIGKELRRKKKGWNPSGEESVITGEGEEFGDFGFGDGIIK